MWVPGGCPTMSGVTSPFGRDRTAPLHRRELHDRVLLDLEGGAVTPSNEAELTELAMVLNTLPAGLVVFRRSSSSTLICSVGRRCHHPPPVRTFAGGEGGAGGRLSVERTVTTAHP